MKKPRRPKYPARVIPDRSAVESAYADLAEEVGLNPMPLLARLRQLRLERNLSYHQLAADIKTTTGVSINVGSLHRILRLKQIASARTLFRFQKYCNAENSSRVA